MKLNNITQHKENDMATNETLTVHKALAELKLIDNRIIKAIGEGTYCVANKRVNDKIRGIPVSEYKNIMKGYYDKVNDLMARRKAIKKAVVLSNAKTKVKIHGTEYTVAEAIELKNHGIEFEELLLRELQEQYQKAQKEIFLRNGDDLEKRAEQYVIGCFGSKETKTDSDILEKTKQEFIKNQTYELVDPNEILKKIEKLESDIAEFKAEVDAALSTSNAVTLIEVTY